MENRGRTKRTRGGGEIIEGERGNKGWREINKKKQRRKESGRLSRSIYIYAADLFKKNRPLSDFIKIR